MQLVGFNCNTRAVRKVTSLFKYLEKWSYGLDVTWQSEETLLCIREQSNSREASQSAVTSCWLSLCTVWPSHSQWSSEHIRFITTMRLPILQLSCRLFWQSIKSPRSVSLHTVHIWLSCNFWLFPKLKSPFKGRRFVNVTVTQYTSSVNGVSLPND